MESVGPVSSDLIKFLSVFNPQVQGTALYLHNFTMQLYPNCFELIYDNYNALSVGNSPTLKVGDAFCLFAVYTKHVNFGFNRGPETSDSEKLLKGAGKLYRYISVT